MDTRNYNLENFEEIEYNEFEGEGDDNVPKMASNNSTVPISGTSTSCSTGRITKRVRSTI